MSRVLHIACLVSAISAGSVGLGGSGADSPAATAAATSPATRPAVEDPFLITDVPVSPAPPMAADELIRFSLVEGFLSVQTPLQPQGPQMRRVAGVPQPVHVIVYPRDSIQMTYAQPEKGLYVRTSLFTSFNHLSLTRDVVGEGVERTIQFIQAPASPTPGRAASLYVQDLNVEAAEGRQAFVAESFSSFIRRYPGQTTRHLRPMVEILSPQPQLFAVDDALGANVFPDAYKTTDQERRAISELIRRLNADDFQVRQKAEKELNEMGIRAATALSAMDRTTLAPEQAARVDAVIAKLKPSTDVDLSQLRSDPGFLLDCMMSENRNLRAAALKQLLSVLNRGVEFDLDAQREQRIRRVYELRKELLDSAATTRPAKMERE